MRRIFCSALISLVLAAPVAAQDSYRAQTRWWKGNTHTHSWWSDGDTPPEVVADWYKKRDYNFLVFSDHNAMQTGEKWYPIKRDATRQALAGYRAMFGDDWIASRTTDGVEEIKLKTLDDFRTLFEEPSSFIFVKGEEITDKFNNQPLHLNGVNLVEKIEPRGGASVREVLQNDLNAVAEQSHRHGQAMLIHLNHPNFHYAVQAEDLIELEHKAGEGFFEIYNGHPRVNNRGDALHIATERMWDVVLAHRLGRLGKTVVYGMAVDDAHEYTAWGLGETNPGRGWVMVRADRLTPNTIAEAMKRGDFYSSTGVTLKSLDIGEGSLSLEVEPQPGAEYVIEFIGTLAKTDLASRGVVTPHAHEGKTDHTHQTVNTYNADIGAVLKRVSGPKAEYRVTGKELYVRARVISTLPHPNGSVAGEMQTAWTQPLVVKR